MQIIHSMTGFGSGLATADGLRARVELRAVNHRGRKLVVRSTPALGALEKNLRDLVGARLPRGMIEARVFVERPVNSEHPPIEPARLQALATELKRLGQETGLGTELALRDILLIPGLLEQETCDPLRVREWPVVEQALRLALDQATAMRAQEGASMVTDLRRLLTPIREFTLRTRDIAPAVVERQRAKLKERVAELCRKGKVEADALALEREICFFAERVDINEELDRLDSHLRQFEAILARGGEAGKRLEFLAQEFLRELNTAATKSGDTGIVKLAMEAKVAVEKIKELAANLE